MSKWVYTFGDGKAEGSAKDKNLLGGKGANLAEMSSLGIPVPPGFTISTEVCTYYYENGEIYPPDLKQQVEAGVAEIERIMGGKFGAEQGPLVLVSVRSGARASMPGMMDTVLNLGLNDKSVLNLIAQTGDERFAYDSYRRFIQMYSDVVLDVSKDKFEHLLEGLKDKIGKHLDVELTAADWKVLVEEYKQEVKKNLGRDFPQDPWEQLWGGIGAVFGSWMNKRAITYRKLNNLPDHWGTAVNVQAMVFGNMGDDCATGVCFSRNPSTGENLFYGEYLVNAQGEDVVAGIRTPQCLSVAEKAIVGSTLPSMEEVLPSLYTELVAIRDRLEKHYRDMQDMEFTIQRNKLWMLQTRNGKRTAAAALRLAGEM
jgi:pyruvate,orthophosphate dikinase